MDTACGQILDNGPAQGYIDHLHSLADPHNRQMMPEAIVKGLKLYDIQLSIYIS